MGFVSVTCTNCGGKGRITPEGGEICTIFFRSQTCLECEGTGSHLVHAGQIGSYRLSIDPAGTNEDDTWAVVWQRQDNDVIEVVDMMKVDPFDQEVQAHNNKPIFGRNSRWS